jgi:phosphoribosylamine---glycine ligase
VGVDVLVVGGGGREHALVSGLARSSRIGRILCAPGNPGIGRYAELVPVAADKAAALADLAERRQVGLVVVGPEVPLVAGLADEVRRRGIPVFGPGRDGARIEGSKAFAKEVMQSAGVPTAKAALFDRYDIALEYLRAEGAPIVVKADGLAAGKGVIVCATMEQAEQALRDCFLDKRFGAAGATVLLEEYLEGEEVSLLAVVSGDQILPLSPAQDYKRALDLDEGPNTGGMGSYSPVQSMTATLYEEAVRTVLRPTVAELAARGVDYQGVLYAGLMLTAAGLKVLEFNCRFGDPETQALIPRLRTDLLDILEAAARGEALPAAADWTAGPAVGVVMASRGYPESSSKGDVIRGLEEAEAVPGVQVFHAGTAQQGAEVVTAGGRVLAVTALGDSFAEARARAYEAVGRIRFDGRQYRTDIALRAELREQQVAR